ncbi:agmatine deiminase [Nitzschia inconspicua]|uniref:Agmatine deiminase n=1 Tax=Nitzschia inconspicua TaxID=303405 RepID=A0A9K3M239_9STRA|nr:agmatine deiminase [Nitzschia inconspicua]
MTTTEIASATDSNTIDTDGVPPPPQVDLETILSVLPLSYNDKSNSSKKKIPPPLHMPAEWSPHSACLILYPHNPQTFRLEKVQQEILYLAQQIVQEGQEDVYLLCHDAKTAEIVQGRVHILMSQQQLKQSKFSICVHVCPSDDTWARDTAPTFVWHHTTDGDHPRRLIGLDWNFNAYGGPDGGGLYWPCTNDQNIASQVCNSPSISAALHIDGSLDVPLILEGGAIHTDGEGTLLTTKECLLNPNRNPHLDQGDIELILRHSLGIEKVLWLPTGLDADEDTNGHVDNFCCFAEPGHVLLAWTDDEEEDKENYQRCRQARLYLQQNMDAQGRQLKITKLYLPSPPLRYSEEEAISLAIPDDENQEESNYIMTRHANEKMAASYINFYIANQAVMVPQFGGTAQDTDSKALETLRQVFPYRSVVGIPSREILLGGGNIHCQTQQVPLVHC